MTTTSLDATQTTDGLEEPQPLVKGTIRRLLGWIIPANISIFIIWGAVPGILLPLQIAGIDPANKVANLDDRHDDQRLRRDARAADRRSALRPHALPLRPSRAVDGRSARSSAASRSSAWPSRTPSCRSRSPGCSCRSPTTSRRDRSAPILPDRVPRAAPRHLRGTGRARRSMLGALGGSDRRLACSAKSIAAGYMFFAGLALVVITLFVVFNPDHSSVETEREPFSLGDFLRTFWVSPRQAPRLLLGLHRPPAALHGLLRRHRLPALHPHGLHRLVETAPPPPSRSSGWPASPASSSRPSSPARCPTSSAAARSSSSSRRSSSASPCSSRWSCPTFEGWLIFSFVSGLGFGCFSAVDQALMSEVLPVEEVLRQGPRRRQHRRDPPADPRSRRRRRDRPHLRLRRPVPGRHRPLDPRRLRGLAHQGREVADPFRRTNRRIVGHKTSCTTHPRHPPKEHHEQHPQRIRSRRPDPRREGVAHQRRQLLDDQGR